MGYKEDDGRTEVEKLQDVLRRQQERHEQSRKMAESLFREGYVLAAGGLHGDPIAPAVEVGSTHFAAADYQFEVQPQESIDAKSERLLTKILASASDPTAVEMAVGLARDPYLADEDKLTLLAMLETQLRE